MISRPAIGKSRKGGTSGDTGPAPRPGRGRRTRQIAVTRGPCRPRGGEEAPSGRTTDGGTNAVAFNEARYNLRPLCGAQPVYSDHYAYAN